MLHLSTQQIQEMELRYRATFINSLGGFKSVILVGTADENSNTNLAIFSSLFHIGANPPLCGLIFRPDESGDRHTLSNIEKTGIYTINHIKADFFKKAHQTSARYPKTTSEFEEVGLHMQYEADILAPFVAESDIKFALKLREKHSLSINRTIMLIGEIIHVIVPDEVVQNDGFIDIEKAGTVTCSGLDSYHTTHKLARLSYAKPDTFPKEI